MKAALTVVALAVVGAALAAQGGVPVRTLRLPDTAYPYANVALPAHFQSARAVDNTPADNPITNDGATVGRVLFYDTALSANGTTSCSSCHKQQHAFADPNRVSRGFDGRFTDRHAMNLTGLRYYPRARFFWDERGGTLEETVLLPVSNPIEMGGDPARLPQKLAALPYYPALFRRAFGDPAITEARIARALAQFLRSLVSYRSRFDEGMARAQSDEDDFENFTRQENRGKALFRRNCATCHSEAEEVPFALLLPSNNGTELDPRSADGGFADITLNALDAGRFKSPTLRNVEVAGPYMHNGSLATLEDVVDHYSRKFNRHPNLDFRMRSLNLTESEKAALVAFLKTLTDRAFLTDPRFSDPFDPPGAAAPPVAPFTPRTAAQRAGAAARGRRDRDRARDGVRRKRRWARGRRRTAKSDAAHRDARRSERRRRTRPRGGPRDHLVLDGDWQRNRDASASSAPGTPHAANPSRSGVGRADRRSQAPGRPAPARVGGARAGGGGYDQHVDGIARHVP